MTELDKLIKQLKFAELEKGQFDKHIEQISRVTGHKILVFNCTYCDQTTNIPRSDNLAKRIYRITGMCKDCQDGYFAE